MPDVKELSMVPRRVLNVFYVLDTSGSMSGAPIATVNNAMIETLDVLRRIAKNNADALIKVAVLTFSSGCKWMSSYPEELDDFIYEDLIAGGLTDFGVALRELDSKLSKNAFMNSATGNYLPVIIFMTDGFATDSYQEALDNISKNRWFSHAMKIGFAIGENPDKNMISKVVGSGEAVIQTNDLDLFARMLKFVSITASMVASKSRTTRTLVSGSDIIKEAIDVNFLSSQNVVGNSVVLPSPDTDISELNDTWGSDEEWK